ncbi:hypothetical protein GLOIN_2v1769038 [Rhizophagus clarus]|uniref:Uncharacterized protein n=1 Tax=Rhizophagus clarus TaxID=94130 RepID=A0A8H3QE61_9GLOM|nr:hypothetical protein GLOIN_2v1769038 [Rhizophagus clarus]
MIADRKFLPEKWLTLNVSTFKKFVIQVQKSIGITVGVEDIDQSEYTLFFKSDKSNGGGLELSDSKDFEKFQNEYEKLFKSQKEIVVVTQMKHNVHKKKRKYEKFLHLTNLQTKLMVIQKKKKVNSIPKVTGLTPQQKAIVHSKLTTKFLATWAECILIGTATIEIAPTLASESLI